MTTLITADRLDVGTQRLTYRDPGSGHLIVVTTPRVDPELWRRYLAGAWRSYRAHGVESVLDLEQIVDGRSSSLLFVALAGDGEMVGGMRSQGPYTSADQSHAVVEWAGDPGQPVVRAMIDRRLPFGVVESKAAWVADRCPDRRELVACLSRAPIHAAMVLGARFALGTSAAHTLALWTATGAVVATEVAPVCYPDERYRTQVLWWDRWALPATVAESEKLAIDAEATQLLDPFVPAQADRR